MRRRVLLPALLLAGCASVPAPQGGSSVSGRLSVQVDATAERPAQSLSASFDLQGSAERGELRLGTPLGTTLALASWSPDEARLATPQGERRFANLEGLSREVFGEALPLRALPDWLRGRPWAGAAEPARPLPTGPGFMQLGWTLDLARFDDGLLQAWRAGPPAVRLRAQVDAAP
ncbi:MAG: outer membrane lipoprotein LolB [Rubrivivax sp.]|nr:outer membrane lipoprotein LolB [Rubrivivax sp.]